MAQKIKHNNLNNFVLDNGGSLSHATHLIVDLSGLTDNYDEIISAINTLRRVYADTRLIVLADDEKIKQGNHDLLRRIFEKGIYDIITDTSDEQLENAVLWGKTKEDATAFFVERPNLCDDKRKTPDAPIHEAQANAEEQAKRNPAQHTAPVCKREIILPDKSFRKYKPYVSVAVCGVEPHIGATHHALLITKFLGNIGFRACYLEANDSRKINLLQPFYPANSNANSRKNLLQCFGVDIYAGFDIGKVMAENYDFYVFDLGVLTGPKLTSFLTKDIRVLVGGARAWEIGALGESIKLIGAKNMTNIFLNFLINGEETKIYAVAEHLRDYVFFPEYVPNAFAGNVNLPIYKRVFQEYIVRDERVAVKEKAKRGLFKKIF